MADLTIADLSPDLIAQKEEFLRTFLAENYPQLDLSEGRVLRDILIRPAAILHALVQTQADLLRQSQSMLAISTNPQLADPALVDAVLSNYRIVRQPGGTAGGQVAIVINTLTTTTIQSQTNFTIGDLVFTAPRAFVGVTTAEAAAIDPTTQRQIFRRTDGTYAFIIDVVASAVGEQYNLKRNTAFEHVSPAPIGLIQAYAYQDFTAGADAQTNEDLVKLFEQGISPQVLSGRIQIDSLIRSIVPSILADSITGMGDPEMLRDRHNIFAISQGGKADIYSRTAPFPESRQFTLTATLVDTNLGLWQLPIGRDVFPGFYDVEAVVVPGTPLERGSLEVTLVTYGLDRTQSTNEFVPDILTLTEGRYSRYQTAIVQFLDLDSAKGLALGATKEYQIYIRGMPGIDTLQSTVVDRGKKNPNADYLVRAPVPAFCTISLEIQYVNDSYVPDANAVKVAIVDMINSLNFTLGRLPASLIYDAVHSVIGTQGTLVVSPIDMYAVIASPSGGTIPLRSGNELVIPNLPADDVTSRTTVFLISPADIDLNIEPVAVLPV